MAIAAVAVDAAVVVAVAAAGAVAVVAEPGAAEQGTAARLVSALCPCP